MKKHARYALAILFTSCAALAAPKTVRKEKPYGLPRHGMWVYSDLCIHPESGEFGGQRITLQRFAEVDTVIYEYTAGGLSWPVVAGDVNVDPRGKLFYFTVQPADQDEKTISGSFSADGRMLTLEGSYCGEQGPPMQLPLVRDFGAKPKTCKACPPSKAQPHEEEPQPEPKPSPKWEPAPPTQA
ncbi:hypothetical protein [Massilia sp. YIM B04103]|uniref:hypothetical protein n=1 Tax=Massilia sp. YIM B04103 TaxID=2963106 RepID=UPI002108AD57|nr:hypothetical protein [Massilia sp. YIM B04103]